MYKMKQKLEDFHVEEIPKLELEKKGDYSYYLMEKINWNTMDAVKAIASRLKIKKDRINVAGIKDKEAVTKQYVSIFNVNRNNVERLKIRDIKLDFVGYGRERLRLGQIKANKFVIIVRNLDKKYEKINFIENYFDDQRFGGRNHILGKALIKREFRKVCYSLRLKWKEGDYVNPIRSLGKRLLRFYINAYQSYLFNRVLLEYLSQKYKDSYKVDYSLGEFIFSNEIIKNLKIPIIGFLTEFKETDIRKIYYKLMKEEKITKEDFLIREIPEISSEGNERDLIAEVKDLNVIYGDDELNKGKMKGIISFNLPPGCYGTIVVKKMFNL